MCLPRSAGWSRQQSELYRSIHRWYGVLHGVLGQLPQDMELRLFLTSEQEERAVHISLGEIEEDKKKLEFEGGMLEPHRVRRGYFNCAKSYLMLERGL